jgi:phenylalanyl-tRNA synthetase beta chain
MLGIEICKEDMEVELNRLDFPYIINGDEFTVIIPKRRLDIDPNINDIAEEIGRLYGYHNLISTLPKSTIKKGEYIGDVKYRKIASKRLRTLGLNETKTYTLVSKEMSQMFKYEDKENIILPNPMSNDKSVVRTTLLPSLLKVYEYNKTRKINDIMLYEISKTYDINYNEESKIAILMKGNYISNKWQNNSIKVDFYLIKGIVENILDYMGFKNRYEFIEQTINNIHPGISAKILLDRQEIGIIGRIHPNTHKDEIYVSELSLTKLIKPIKPIKYKESSKYPDIKKDIAFIVDKQISSKDIEQEIKKAGGRLLTNIDVFDIYTGENVGENEKSVAYNLTFQAQDKTLTDDEVMTIFNNIIKNVENKLNAKLRSN